MDVRWVTADTAVTLNQDLMSLTGEPHGLRDRGLLESACAVPINRFLYEGEDDLVRLAVALILAIARNHPFVQGNKRTAFTMGLTLLELNGRELRMADEGSAADLLAAVVAGEAHPDDLERFLISAAPTAEPEG